MRRGWKPEWDWVERKVWTGVAFIWAFTLISILALWPFSLAQVQAAQSIIGVLIYNVLFYLAFVSVFVYVGLWLRRQLAPSPSGKERDR